MYEDMKKFMRGKDPLFERELKLINETSERRSSMNSSKLKASKPHQSSPNSLSHNKTGEDNGNHAHNRSMQEGLQARKGAERVLRQNKEIKEAPESIY
jgi:hypothetical protein